MFKKLTAFKYFKYFQNIVGIHMFGYILINFLVGLMDSFGLVMFIPLLSIATGSSYSSESIGDLSFLLDFINILGFEVNLISTLTLMVVLFILKGLFTYLRIVYYIRIRLKIMRSIRFQMIDGLYGLSYSSFTKVDAGKIQNNMVGEINRASNAFTFYFISVQHIIMLLTYLVIAFYSNWRFAIMVAIGGGVTNFLYKYVYDVTKKKSKELTTEGNNFNDNLIQTIHNFKYLKATDYFTKYKNKIHNNIFKSESISYKIGKIGAMAESLREPLIIVVISVVIIIQINYFGNGFGTILASLLLFYRSLSYLVSMQNSWNNFISNSAGIDSIEELIDYFKKDKEPHFDLKIDFIKNIEVNNLILTIGKKNILKNITITIPYKNSVAFVGESGAGKTTLANVICGLQSPTSGIVKINDKNLYETNLNHYRNKIGYITQEPVVFNDNIYNNVTFWAEKSKANLEKFWNTMKLVSLVDFVNSLEEKENTELGSNGILISGGQKQRISIARELYKDIELLIMDEATSALDSETETFIKDNINQLHGKLSIIVIAHRLSTIKMVDKIFLMDKGEIVESGSFNELTKKSAQFKKMVELQEV